MGSLERLRPLISTADATAFWRYAIIGIAQNAFFYNIGLLLLALGWAAWQTIVIVYPIAMIVSFAANRSWAFRVVRSRAQFRKYIVVYGAAYPASVLLTWVQEHHGLRPWLATLTTMIVAAVAIFAALRLWVFARPMAKRYDLT